MSGMLLTWASFPRLLDIILEQSDVFIAVVSIETCTLGCRMDTKCCLHHMIHSSLVPRPSYVFQHTWEKSGRPGRLGDVMMTYMPPFLRRFFTNGGRYVIIASPNRPCLPDAHWKTWEGGHPMDVVVRQVYLVMFHVPVRPLVQTSLCSLRCLSKQFTH